MSRVVPRFTAAAAVAVFVRPPNNLGTGDSPATRCHEAWTSIVRCARFAHTAFLVVAGAVITIYDCFGTLVAESLRSPGRRRRSVTGLRMPL